jgi:hypothetical protein
MSGPTGSRCADCGAPIVWASVRGGRRLAVDATTDTHGNPVPVVTGDGNLRPRARTDPFDPTVPPLLEHTRSGAGLFRDHRTICTGPQDRTIPPIGPLPTTGWPMLHNFGLTIDGPKPPPDDRENRERGR